MTANSQSVVIAGERFGFPYGSGAAARVLAYASMLRDEGVPVDVYCLDYTENTETGALNDKNKGVYNEISFEYLCGSPIRGSTFLQRIFRRVSGKVRLVTMLLTQTPKPAAIIGYSKKLNNIFLMSLAARIRNIPLIYEMCEITFKEKAANSIEEIRRKLRYFLIALLIDGYIPISNYILSFIEQNYPFRKPTIKIPILVDTKAFSSVIKSVDMNITYLGNLNRTDEITQLLTICSKVRLRYPEVVVRIIGNATDENQEKYMEFARNLGMKSIIDWTGAVKRDQLPSLLAQSTVLVLPRNKGLFSAAGFPTKLGEYLASGRPVVTADVGEIAEYIVNGIHGYIVQPGEVSKFADAISMLLEDEDLSDTIGRNGKQLAFESFDLAKHSRKLVAFIEELQK